MHGAMSGQVGTPSEKVDDMKPSVKKDVEASGDDVRVGVQGKSEPSQTDSWTLGAKCESQ